MKKFRAIDVKMPFWATIPCCRRSPQESGNAMAKKNTFVVVRYFGKSEQTE